MRNLVKSLIIVLSCLVANVAWAENKVYKFEAESDLDAEWTVTKVVPDGGNGTCESGKSNKFDKKDGNYLLFGFENKSGITITITSKESFSDINNIYFDVVANDNSKPNFTLNIVDDNGNVVKNIYDKVGSKDAFGTGGTSKWGKSENTINPVQTGHIQLILIASSSGKYAAIDNLKVTYGTGGSGEGGGDDPDPGTETDAYAHWQFSGSNVPEAGSSENGTKIKVEFLTKDAGKAFTIEDAAYNTAVPDDMKSKGKKGLKLGGNALYLKVSIDDGFEVGDELHICGYLPWKISTTEELTGDVIASLTTGTSKTDYNVGKHTLTQAADALYLMRAQGNGTGICAIKVVRDGEEETPVVSKVEVNPTSWTMEIDETKQLEATVTVEPDKASYKKVTWKSSNEAVATVSENGLVKAIGAGTATITATSTKDETKQGTCAITVNEPAEIIEVQSIALNETEKTILIGEKLTLTVTYTPDDANTGKGITWSSSDATVAKVEGGVVTGLKEGTATITATTEKGKTATCEVTVKPVAVESVSLDKTEATVKVDATLKLTATVLPANATNKDVTWSTSDATIATVDKGTVTGVAEGEATITVKTVDGEKTAECKVKVEAKQTPQTDLKLHTPEVYEDPAGYNTPLVKFNDREYEVYYTGKGKIGGQGNTYPLVYTDAEGNEISDGTKAKDRWFVYNIAGCEDKNGATKDEFTISRGRWKAATDNDSLIMRVKGYDCFRLFAADKKEADPKQQFHVYIDDMTQEVSMTHSESASIREFTLSTDEHVIKIEAKGTSNQYIFGWSLRVSNDPLVRQVAGPKEQTVYQTKEIEPTAYVVRRAAKSKLAWKDDKAAEGISMTEGTNDSVFVSGKATAAVGTYTYIVQALDAEDKVAATETGTLTIETHVFDCERGNDFKAEVGEQIRPLSFKFYAANKEDITLNCDIEGLTLTKKDSIAVLEGTPSANTAEGEHTYSIKAAGGNTVSGTITVSIPDPYFEPIAEVIARINQQVTFALIARHAETVTVTGLPNGFTCKYDKATDKATITGTPTTEGEVPFTATATPRYQGKQTVTADGKLIVIGQNEKIMLVVHKDLESINDEPVAKLIKDTKGFYVTMRKQEELEGSSVEAFDFLFISENVDADHKAVQQLTKEGGKPMLNMKAFTYSPDRLNWGQPNNGTVDTVTHNGQNIFVERNDHPIFEGKQHGETITILSQIVQKGVMPITINSETLGGSYCLATAYTRDIKNYYKDGELQTFLHEIPAAVRGKKYICMPIALSSSKYLTDAGKNLVSKVVDYLMDEEPFTLPATELQINSFVVEGFEATIEANYTIELEIPANRFQELDSLKHAKPVIELEDPIYAHVSPESGEEVDLHYATFMPVVYEVTNYIKRQAYDVYVRIIGTQGIEGIYSVGEWVNIYDIFGRKVTTTNEDVYQMELPRGVYIVVTSEGQTLKIMR